MYCAGPSVVKLSLRFQADYMSTQTHQLQVLTGWDSLSLSRNSNSPTTTWTLSDMLVMTIKFDWTSINVLIIITKLNPVFDADHFELHAQIPASATHSKGWWKEQLWLQQHEFLHTLLSWDCFHRCDFLPEPHSKNNSRTPLITARFTESCRE